MASVPGGDRDILHVLHGSCVPSSLEASMRLALRGGIACLGRQWQNFKMWSLDIKQLIESFVGHVNIEVQTQLRRGLRGAASWPSRR